MQCRPICSRDGSYNIMITWLPRIRAAAPEENVHPNLEKLKQEIERATAGLNESQLNKRVAGKWSPAENIEHLLLAFTATVKGCNRCLETGKRIAGTPTMKDRLAAFLVTGMGFFPRGRKSPERAVPTGTL